MKTRNLIVLSLIGLFIAISSCRDDFDYDLASDNLSFSNDTINLDTIFNYTNSQTYKLTVHNNQNKDIEIPKIYLSRGEGSFFKINVDGTPGYEFENVAVRKKDSIFIFVEIAAGEAPVNPAYEDEINFETTNGAQQVKLLSYIEKAEFYIPEPGQDEVQVGGTWDNSKSRVIFGNAIAGDLTISHGTKVYFHHDASLTVNGNLNVAGDIHNKVIFRTDRMDERSDSLPNMWGKIHLKNNTDSKINYAAIKGANIGLEIENSKLIISNTKILNNDLMGIYAHGTSNVTGKNLVLNNSDLASLAIEGGTYKFTHCTFANYHNIGQGAGYNYSLWLADENILENAEFYNCIFYGNSLNTIQIDVTGNYVFKNNVIRNETGMNFDPSNITEDPMFLDMFVNPGFGKNDLRLLQTEGSSIPGHGDSIYIMNDEILENDILGDPRTPPLTPGAYQKIVDPATLD